MLSTLSLVSLSSKSLVGLFGSIFIGAQVTFTVLLSGLSVPKTSLRATPTREIALLPTKCVLSSGSVLFPRICISVGFATVILASLFCILRSKGFMSSTPAQKQNDVASQPPSPPPEPGSSSSVAKAPRRFRWLLFLTIALLVLLITASLAAGVYFAYYVPPAVQELAFFCSQKLVAIERKFWDGWDVPVSYFAAAVSYLSKHGLQPLQILGLGLLTHSVCAIVFDGLCRSRRYLSTVGLKCKVLASVFAVTMVCVASFTQLNWTFWMAYYVCRHSLPSVRRINWNVLHFSAYLSSLAATQLDKVSTVVGIVIIHAFVTCVWVVIVIVLALPSAVRGLLWTVSKLPLLRFLVQLMIRYITDFCLLSLVLWSAVQFTQLRPADHQLLWSSVFCQSGRPFACKLSRQQSVALFWRLVGRYKGWKAVQIEDFKELAAAAPNTLIARLNSVFEIWHGLHPMQKLLITAPALVFYGFLIVSLSRAMFFSFSSRFSANSSPPYAGSRDVSGTGYESFRTCDTDDTLYPPSSYLISRLRIGLRPRTTASIRPYRKRERRQQATGAAMRIINTGGDAFQYTFLATSKLSHL